MSSRRLLQVTSGFLVLLTIGLGGMSLLRGVRSPTQKGTVLPDLPVLDRNLRFMGGPGMGLDLALPWIIPSIERQSKVYKIVWLCAFTAGIGRLLSGLGVLPDVESCCADSGMEGLQVTAL